MGWIEAAWAVKKIQENLQIPNYLIRYTDLVNQLNHDVNNAKRSLAIDTEKTIVVAEELNNLTNTMNEADEKLNQNLQMKENFIDYAEIINNRFSPKTVSSENIHKNVIWFIQEDNNG